MRRLVAIVPVLTIGCATIGLGPPVALSEHQVSTRTEMVPTTAFVVSSSVTGTMFTLSLFHACDERSIGAYEVTERRERVNPAASGDWTLLAAGGASVLVGGVLLVDAGRSSCT
ncbi:MAG: hypothetical protein ACHREM_23660, partial [Polyangiales bacterium]